MRHVQVVLVVCFAGLSFGQPIISQVTNAASYIATGPSRVPVPDRSPGSTTGTPSRPLRKLLPALGAGEERPDLSHAPDPKRRV